MGRYYRRRYYGGYYRNHQSERSRLSSQFAGIDREIESIFLKLESHSLNGLLLKYGKKHGKSAESYARKTYPKWKRGEVKLSGQTAQRLLELVPPFLSTEKRYELVKRLREKYVKKGAAYVSASIYDWREKIAGEVNKLVEDRRSFDFNEALKNKATWLTSGDTENAKKILNALDEEEAKIRASYLESEFKRIEYFIATVENTESITHTLDIPQGTVRLSIELESKKRKTGFTRLLVNGGNTMDRNKKEIIPKERQDLEVIQNQSGNLLDSTLGDLTESERAQWRKRIVDEKIDLDVSLKKADQRHFDSTRDLANAIKTVQGLEGTTKSDYDVRQSSETASGKIDVHVKKNNNTTIIVVAVIIGIILLILANG